MLWDFAGRWSLSRRIEDRLDGTVTHVDGVATLTDDGAGLTWDEAGTMRRPDGTILSVGRRYLWRPHPAGGIAVAFDDGRPFHSFDPARVEAHEAEHPCGPDRYRVRYSFDLPGRFSSAWRVTGPRNDYLSTTEHVRLS